MHQGGGVMTEFDPFPIMRHSKSIVLFHSETKAWISLTPKQAKITRRSVRGPIIVSSFEKAL